MRLRVELFSAFLLAFLGGEGYRAPFVLFLLVGNRLFNHALRGFRYTKNTWKPKFPRAFFVFGKFLVAQFAGTGIVGRSIRSPDW